MSAPAPCWLCAAPAPLIRPGRSAADVTPERLRITDAEYGTTLSLHRCEACGFRFCPEAAGIVQHYRALEDTEYEATRTARLLQAKRLLRALPTPAAGATLLDMGAGSGILVEAAGQAGFHATGLEPSGWLCARAQARGLDVRHGGFGEVPLPEPFDVITLIDVIEHVDDPLAMLRFVRAHLKPGGLALIVTPDVGSLAARVMGARWWHYRTAHIGYFSRRTLALACARAGLAPRLWRRPSWVFPLDYLLARLSVYLPPARWLARWKWLSRIALPVNPLDSLLLLTEAKPQRKE